MRSETVTVILDVPSEEAFDFLADVANLPEWATEFARELKEDGGRTKVVNNLGEFFFEIEANAEHGVIDMYAGSTAEAMALFPTRLVTLPTGDTAFSFTMFQMPGMSDELFEAQHASLGRELENVRARFRR